MDIERAKGLAIILVVAGHLSSVAPPGNAWYMLAKQGVYQFHMAFFMCLSGVTMYLSSPPGRSATAYCAFLGKKARRLLLPILVFGGVLLVGKQMAARIMPVDHLPGTLLSGALELASRPIASPVGFLWYVYVLFLFYAAVPLLLRICRGNLWYLLLFAAALHLLRLSAQLTDYFAVRQFAQYLLFLVVGMLLAHYRTQWKNFLERYGALFLLAFMTALAAYFMAGGPPLPGFRTLLGLLSIPALLALVYCRWGWQSSWLGIIGSYSFTIYLISMPVMGLIKGAAVTADYWRDDRFVWVALTMIIAGVIVPILLSRLCFQRLPWLDRITR
jgi:peptidoglycan/LPS O-acetylase OafA/YrhL